jgi:hypothetical protein
MIELEVVEIAFEPSTDAMCRVRVNIDAHDSALTTMPIPQRGSRLWDLADNITSRDRQTMISPEHIDDLGRGLHDLLMDGIVGTLVQKAAIKAKNAQRLLQIRLSLAAHEDLLQLARLPWELMMDATGIPLVTRHSLVRTIPQAAPMLPLRVDGPLTMLLVWAMPADLMAEDPINIAAEVAAITAQIEPLRARGELKLHILPDATSLGLRRAIRNFQPHLVHLIGHGSGTGTGQPALILAGEQGQIDPVTPQQLSACFTTQAVRLVVLNACHSSALGATLFRSFGPILLSAGVPAIVGMQAPVQDAAGRAFATEFYQRLVATGSVDQAVQEGRGAIIATNRYAIEWGLATVYMGTYNTLLFAQQGIQPQVALEPSTTYLRNMLASCYSKRRILNRQHQGYQEGSVPNYLIQTMISINKEIRELEERLRALGEDLSTIASNDG